MCQKEKKVVKAGTLIDGKHRETLENVSIVIDGNQIQAIKKSEEMDVPNDAKVIDAMDQTVLPGLIDAHLHLFGMETDDFVKESIVRDDEVGIIKNIFDARDLLEAGFTTVKDCGSKGGLYLKKAMQEDWAKNRIKAPRIVTAGYVTLSQTFGHGDTHYFPLEYAKEENPGICDGVPECKQKARLALREGADFIKIMATGGVLSQRDRPENIEFTMPELDAIVNEAEKAGTFVTAHAEGTEGIKNAIEAGVKTVDHCDLIDSKGIEMAKARDVIMVPTLSISYQIMEGGIEAGYPEWGVEKQKKLWEPSCKNIERAYNEGVTIAAATDFCGSELLQHGNNAMELELLVEKCNFKPIDAIIAATANAAKACDLEDKVGTIEQGKMADLIIFEGDPLEDISLLQDHEKIKGVFKGGVLEVDRGL